MERVVQQFVFSVHARQLSIVPLGCLNSDCLDNYLLGRKLLVSSKYKIPLAHRSQVEIIPPTPKLRFKPSGVSRRETVDKGIEGAHPRTLVNLADPTVTTGDDPPGQG